MFTGDIPEVYGRVTGSVQEGNRKVTGEHRRVTGVYRMATGVYGRVTGRAAYFVLQ